MPARMSSWVSSDPRWHSGCHCIWILNYWLWFVNVKRNYGTNFETVIYSLMVVETVSKIINLSLSIAKNWKSFQEWQQKWNWNYFQEWDNYWNYCEAWKETEIVSSLHPLSKLISNYTRHQYPWSAVHSLFSVTLEFYFSFTVKCFLNFLADRSKMARAVL